MFEGDSRLKMWCAQDDCLGATTCGSCTAVATCGWCTSNGKCTSAQYCSTDWTQKCHVQSQIKSEHSRLRNGLHVQSIGKPTPMRLRALSGTGSGANGQLSRLALVLGVGLAFSFGATVYHAYRRGGQVAPADRKAQVLEQEVGAGFERKRLFDERTAQL